MADWHKSHTWCMDARRHIYQKLVTTSAIRAWQTSQIKLIIIKSSTFCISYFVKIDVSKHLVFIKWSLHIPWNFKKLPRPWITDCDARIKSAYLWKLLCLLTIICVTPPLPPGWEGVLHQIFSSWVQHAIQDWTQLDLRFCKNEGSKRSKISETQGQLDRKSRRNWNKMLKNC